MLFSQRDRRLLIHLTRARSSVADRPTRRPAGPILVVALGWAFACSGSAARSELPPAEEVENLTPQSAAEYMKAERGLLRFHRVRALDPATAAKLAEHAGGVSLPSIAALDANVARALAASKASIELNGIQALPGDVAGALAAGQAQLTMEALRELTSVPLAQKFSRQPGVLRFPHVQQLDAPIATAISGGAVRLHMPGLRQLTHEGLAARLGEPGKAADLPHVEVLNAKVAAGLARGGSNVYLPAVKKLDNETAASLVNHEGALQLSSLQDIPPEGLACLLRNQGPLSIGAVQAFGPAGQPVDKQILQALSAHKWPVVLGLNPIPADVAAAIKERQAPVYLDGIQHLTVELAQSLIGCSCHVYLMRVENVDNGVAAALVKHRHPMKNATGFVLPVTAKQLFNGPELQQLEKHDSICFGNLLD